MEFNKLTSNQLNRSLYGIYYASKKRNGKSKNGDSLYYSELINEGLVILTVSDGVGSLAKDWLASETTCKVFIDSFVNQSGDIESRMIRSVRLANSGVLSIANKYNMAATLVAVVVDFNSEIIYSLSIGDSRIFILNNERNIPISKDDTISVPVKMNNEIVINDGLPVFNYPITKAVGQKDKLEIEIKSCQFNPGESVILATDGIHNHGLLPHNILEAFVLRDMSVKLQLVAEECAQENNDDATILILRRNDFPKNTKSIYQNTILKNLDFKTEKLYGHLLTDCAIELIEESINKKDWETIEVCLEYIYHNKLLPNRDILVSWLDKIIAHQINDGNILMQLRKLIQISL